MERFGTSPGTTRASTTQARRGDTTKQISRVGPGADTDEDPQAEAKGDSSPSKRRRAADEEQHEEEPKAEPLEDALGDNAPGKAWLVVPPHHADEIAWTDHGVEGVRQGADGGRCQ